LPWQQQQPQSQNTYDDDSNYGSQSGQPGGGYPQQPGVAGQQPGGYPPPAPAGDNGASALFAAIGNIGTAADIANRDSQIKAMSAQAITRQAQDFEQTQLAGMMGSAGADNGCGEGGNAAGHLSGNHPEDINDNKQYPAEYWVQKN